jgi:tetratricopeptide (TPR) repeat protein
MRVMLFPVGLSALYPTVAATGILDPAVWWGAVMIALQAGIVLFVRVKMVRFIVLWYLLSLLPVLQIVPMMAVPSAAADRYAYVPSLPFALAPAVILWQVRAALVKRGSVAVPAALVAAAVVYAGVLGVATWSRNRVWRSSETLWRDVLAKNPNERFALVNLGQVYLDAGNLTGARELFNAAVRVDPGFIIAYANLGLSYEKSGNLTEARVFYETALGHGSSLTKRSTFEQRGRAAFGLAGICFQERKFNSARHLASEAMLLFPEFNGPRGLYVRADAAIKTSKALADALIATGDVLADADFAKARDVYLRASDEALEYPAPLVRLARLCQSYGLHRDAVDAFARASELGQTGADFEYEYGVAALQSGDYEVASERLATAVAIDPGMEKARVKWAVARAYLGQPAQALEMLAGVLAADPGNADARENFDAIKAFIEKKIGELPDAAK